VIVNRLDNKLFSKGSLSTLTAVVNVAGQFNAVTGPPSPNVLFTGSAPGQYENLDAADCLNLALSILAMEVVAEEGATASYNFFHSAPYRRAGSTTVGGSVFWTVSPQPKPTNPKKPRKKGRGPV